MKNYELLTVTSLLAIVLFAFHITDDVVRGFEPGGLKNLNAIAIMVLWSYATLMLAGRRSGYVILALGSLLAAGIPALHMSGKGIGAIPRPAAATSSSGRCSHWV